MKINETNQINRLNSYQKQNEARVSGTSKARQKDEVQISAAAKEMLTTSQMTSAERTQQIEQLKSSVASGTYHVEAGKIAEKLLPYLKNNQSE
ncbi:flagellar biosynthesis anti-sigma factor FlgM [Paenibacillus paridis]|jgi:negative regulator of flagellin synthesis FlgM|uniref:flagellar biosynthesis anti-sigma factor FlgM n=1 Tax=Paenibacillus paridis TaxID=2583376 RepID=UPI0011245C85|nr:flagellar biosynthesis anti-sigma factor FlgM [Paenibacillus paridis]